MGLKAFRDALSNADHWLFQGVVKHHWKPRRKDHKKSASHDSWQKPMQLFKREPYAESVRQVDAVRVFCNQASWRRDPSIGDLREKGDSHADR